MRGRLNGAGTGGGMGCQAAAAAHGSGPARRRSSSGRCATGRPAGPPMPARRSCPRSIRHAVQCLPRLPTWGAPVRSSEWRPPCPGGGRRRAPACGHAGQSRPINDLLQYGAKSARRTCLPPACLWSCREGMPPGKPHPGRIPPPCCCNGGGLQSASLAGGPLCSRLGMPEVVNVVGRRPNGGPTPGCGGHTAPGRADLPARAGAARRRCTKIDLLPAIFDTGN